MREIKFRAWVEDKMVDLQKITPLALSDAMNSQLAMKELGGLFIPFSNKVILMQYTGLKDKNGKEIYEGDIVSHQNGIQEVLYDNNTASFQMSLNSFVLDQEVCDYDSVEVIGNIYENSNLTEGNNAN